MFNTMIGMGSVLDLHTGCLCNTICHCTSQRRDSGNRGSRQEDSTVLILVEGGQSLAEQVEMGLAIRSPALVPL